MSSRAGEVRDSVDDAGDDVRPFVAFCGGSGVTPVMSIIRDLLATSDRPITILYANRDRASVIFAGDLDALARAHPDRLHVRHHLDDEHAFVTPDVVAELVDHAPDADYFICGPGPFMDLVESTLVDAGIRPERISIERFVIDGTDLPDATGDPGDSTDPQIRSGAEPAEVTIVLGGKPTTVSHQAGDTLLETARRGALAPPFSCESGNCATCMALVREGSASMRCEQRPDPRRGGRGMGADLSGPPRKSVGHRRVRVVLTSPNSADPVTSDADRRLLTGTGELPRAALACFDNAILRGRWWRHGLRVR